MTVMYFILKVAAGVFIGIITARQFDTCKECGHWRMAHKSMAVAGNKCDQYE